MLRGSRPAGMAALAGARLCDSTACGYVGTAARAERLAEVVGSWLRVATYGGPAPTVTAFGRYSEAGSPKPSLGPREYRTPHSSQGGSDPLLALLPFRREHGPASARKSAGCPRVRTRSHRRLQPTLSRPTETPHASVRLVAACRSGLHDLDSCTSDNQ